MRLSILIATFALLTSTLVQAASPVFTGTFGHTAIRGYDAVAYFDEGKPAEGSKDFRSEWNGAEWRFTSAEHLMRFKAAPEKYAPQFGGYCAYAVGAKKQLVSSDPQAWDIVDGKLYLNYDKDVQRLWKADRARYIQQGQANWPGLSR